jgi:tetrahydromethanopterin S-methyltransferase subunit D
MAYASGLATSIVVFAVGAVLDFAVTIQSSSVNWNKVGVILMIVGAVGFVVSLALTALVNSRSSYRRSRRVTEDGAGTYVEERGSY